LAGAVALAASGMTQTSGARSLVASRRHRDALGPSAKPTPVPGATERFHETVVASTGPNGVLRAEFAATTSNAVRS
jgi:hypothetical protein